MHYSMLDFDPLYKCVCASSRDGKQSGDFQHISTHSFYLFSFQMRFQMRTWFVECSWRALSVSCWVRQSRNSPQRDFSFRFIFKKVFFSSFFIWSDEEQKNEWIPSIELSIFVYSLFMCVVSLSPNIFTIYMHPLFIFLSLTLPLSFQSGKINDHVDDILTLEVTNKLKNWKSM